MYASLPNFMHMEGSFVSFFSSVSHHIHHISIYDMLTRKKEKIPWKKVRIEKEKEKASVFCCDWSDLCFSIYLSLLCVIGSGNGKRRSSRHSSFAQRKNNSS